jgi:hypothetical protein
MIKTISANSTLTDTLGKIGDIKVENGIVKITIPARTAAILTRK